MSCFPHLLRVLGQALAVGTTVLGAVSLLIVLYLSPVLGVLLLGAATAIGLLCLTARHLLLRHRIGRAAALGAAQAQTWLDSQRGRAEGAA